MLKCSCRQKNYPPKCCPPWRRGDDLRRDGPAALAPPRLASGLRPAGRRRDPAGVTRRCARVACGTQGCGRSGEPSSTPPLTTSASPKRQVIDRSCCYPGHSCAASIFGTPKAQPMQHPVQPDAVFLEHYLSRALSRLSARSPHSDDRRVPAVTWNRRRRQFSIIAPCNQKGGSGGDRNVLVSSSWRRSTARGAHFGRLDRRPQGRECAAQVYLRVCPPRDSASRIGNLTSDEPLILWFYAGLMMFFFLLVSMEIKRELLEWHPSRHPNRRYFPRIQLAAA